MSSWCHRWCSPSGNGKVKSWNKESENGNAERLKAQIIWTRNIIEWENTIVPQFTLVSFNWKKRRESQRARGNKKTSLSKPLSRRTSKKQPVIMKLDFGLKRKGKKALKTSMKARILESCLCQLEKSNTQLRKRHERLVKGKSGDSKVVDELDMTPKCNPKGWPTSPRSAKALEKRFFF